MTCGCRCGSWSTTRRPSRRRKSSRNASPSSTSAGQPGQRGYEPAGPCGRPRVMLVVGPGVGGQAVLDETEQPGLVEVRGREDEQPLNPWHDHAVVDQAASVVLHRQDLAEGDAVQRIPIRQDVVQG